MEVELLGVLFLTIVAPIWIIAHYITKNRGVRGLSREDEETLGDVWETAKRMEERIDTLERILDDHHPGWRGQA